MHTHFVTDIAKQARIHTIEQILTLYALYDKQRSNEIINLCLQDHDKTQILQYQKDQPHLDNSASTG